MEIKKSSIKCLKLGSKILADDVINQNELSSGEYGYNYEWVLGDFSTCDSKEKCVSEVVDFLGSHTNFDSKVLSSLSFDEKQQFLGDIGFGSVSDKSLLTSVSDGNLIKDKEDNSQECFYFSISEFEKELSERGYVCDVTKSGYDDSSSYIVLGHVVKENQKHR